MLRALCIALAVVAVPFFANLSLASGAPEGGVRIVVPAHDIPRGAVIADSDLSYQTASAAQMFSGTVTSMNDLDGMQTRRVLREGEPVRGDDVRRPILVTKGSTVTMTFSQPGITLTANGKAMTEGGMGETVTVLNPVSYRQVTGIVTGAGTVRAGDITPVATLSNPQLASAQP